MRLEIGELMSLNANLVNLKDEMAQILSRVNAELDNISKNIESSGLITANNNFGSQIIVTSNALKNTLTEITNFFEQQIKSYSINLDEIYTKIENLIKVVDGCIDEKGNIIKKYDSVNREVNSKHTLTTDYDMTNLHKFLKYYEGAGKRDANGDYILYMDSDGSLTAGPGMHIKNLGYDQSKYAVGQSFPKDVIDNAVTNSLINIRTNIENTLTKEQYANINLNDSQIDSLTSLLYNTGKNPEYFLDRYKSATEQGTTLYEYTTKYWVNANGERLGGLVKRRMGENILFEEGYDAWENWINSN